LHRSSQNDTISGLATEMGYSANIRPDILLLSRWETGTRRIKRYDCCLEDWQ
jgi:hypothetical protein